MEGLAVGDKLLVRYSDADQWFHATVINVATVAGRTRGVGDPAVLGVLDVLTQSTPTPEFSLC